MKTLLELIDDVAKHGGAIVSSAECHELEIATAQACGRFAVREGGMGFLRRPKEWLENPSQADKEEIERLENALAVATELIEKLTAKVERYRNPYGYSAPAKPPKPIDRDTCQHEGCNEKKPEVPGPPDPKPYVCLQHRHLVQRRA